MTIKKLNITVLTKPNHQLLEKLSASLKVTR